MEVTEAGPPGAVRGAPRGAGHVPALRAPAGLLRDAGLRPAAAHVPRPVRAARLRGRRRVRLDRQDHGNHLPPLLRIRVSMWEAVRPSPRVCSPFMKTHKQPNCGFLHSIKPYTLCFRLPLTERYTD